METSRKRGRSNRVAGHPSQGASVAMDPSTRRAGSARQTSQSAQRPVAYSVSSEAEAGSGGTLLIRAGPELLTTSQTNRSGSGS